MNELQILEKYSLKRLRGADLRGAFLCNTNLHNALVTYRNTVIRIKFEEVQ